MEIEVVNLKFANVDRSSVVYIGRPSILGNPWSHVPSRYPIKYVLTREESIEHFREWIKVRLLERSAQSVAIDNCVKQLLREGVLVFGCYCKPLACHGDVLAEIVLERARLQKQLFNDLFD